MSNPFSAWSPGTVGIDIGATLSKIVRRTRPLEMQVFDARDLPAVRRTVEAWGAKRVATTGGGAAALDDALAGIPRVAVPEFEAWAEGAPALAELGGVSLPSHYLVVSLGTGTSILAVQDGKSRRVGGTALGGGSLLGLGRLLLGVESFQEIARLAHAGDRRHVDLLVGDIYRFGGAPLPSDLNAASFAKLASRAPEDLAHALMGMIGENTGLLAGQLARALGADLVLYCGSALLRNPALGDILSGVTGMVGARCHLLEHGAFCGAVGAALLASDREPVADPG